MSIKPYEDYLNAYYEYWLKYFEEMEDELNDAEHKMQHFSIAGLRADDNFGLAVLQTLLSLVPGGNVVIKSTASALLQAVSLLMSVRTERPTLVMSPSIVQRYIPSLGAYGGSSDDGSVATSITGFIDAIEDRLTTTRIYLEKEYKIMKDEFLPALYNSNLDSTIWSQLKQAIPKAPGGKALAIQAVKDVDLDWKFTEAYIVNWARANNVFLFVYQTTLHPKNKTGVLRGITKGQKEFIYSNRDKFASRPMSDNDVRSKWGLGTQYTNDAGFGRARSWTPGPKNIPFHKWPFGTCQKAPTVDMTWYCKTYGGKWYKPGISKMCRNLEYKVGDDQ